MPRQGGGEWGEGQWTSFFCLENKHWRIITLDTAYNSTRFDWGKLPLLQRSKWLRKTTWFKPKCTIPDALLRWLESTVNADGDILLFEANATMVMVPLAPDEKWAYRRTAFAKVFSAVRAMLTDRLAAGVAASQIASK